MTRLGATLVDLEKPADAKFVLDQALEQVRRVFQYEKAGFVFTERAYVATLKGEDRKALAALQQALASFHKDGNADRIWPVEEELGKRYEDLGSLGLALQHYEAALDSLRSLPATPGYPRVIAARYAARLALARKIATLYGQIKWETASEPAPSAAEQSSVALRLMVLYFVGVRSPVGFGGGAHKSRGAMETRLVSRFGRAPQPNRSERQAARAQLSTTSQSVANQNCGFRVPAQKIRVKSSGWAMAWQLL